MTTALKVVWMDTSQPWGVKALSLCFTVCLFFFVVVSGIGDVMMIKTLNRCGPCSHIVVGRCQQSSKCQHECKPFEWIPGPRGLPFIGNIWRYLPLIGNYKIEQLDASGRYNLARYGTIVREEVTPDHRIVWLFDPINMAELFSQEGRYPCRRSHRALLKYRRQRPETYASGGLFPENGPEWLRLRNLFKQHYLLKRNIDGYTDSLVSISNDLVHFVERHRIDGTTRECIDLQQDLYRWALESVWMIMLDARLGCFERDNLRPDSDANRLIDAAHETIDAVMRTELYNDWDTKDRVTADYRRLVASQDVMAEIVDKHLQTKLSHFAANEAICHATLLDQFIANPDINRKDLFGLIMDFVLAGIDTTSITTGFALYYLAKHQDIQQEVRKEIEQTFGDDRLRAEDFSRMPLLRACIKETMRLRPISVGVGRLASREMIIAGYNIPANTMLTTMNQVSCRLDKYYRDAESFCPHRWLNKQKSDQDYENRYLWLPFGHGPRMCLGRRIAELEMNIVLCTILRRYRIEYHHQHIGIKTCLINVPDRPMRFKLVPLSTYCAPSFFNHYKV